MTKLEEDKEIIEAFVKRDMACAEMYKGYPTSIVDNDYTTIAQEVIRLESEGSEVEVVRKIGAKAVIYYS